MKDTEHKIQSEAVKHARLRWPICETNLFAIPNGGARDVRTGKRLKAEGVLPGVWDLFFARPLYNCPEYEDFVAGLWIEVKEPKYRNHKNGGLSKEQVNFREAVISQGYATAVCYTTQEILDAIEEYLEG